MSPAQPGILLCWFEPRDALDLEALNLWRKRAFTGIPGVRGRSLFTATDAVDATKPYRYQNAYDLDDVSQISDHVVERLLSSSTIAIARSDWHVYKLISCDTRDGLDKRPPGAVVISVGMTPVADKESLEDFDEWYVVEHMPMLALVPGWRTGSRYCFVAQYGDAAEYAASHLAVQEYDEQNGLGGEEWKASVSTPWTKKVAANVSAPHHRRVWRVEADPTGVP